MLSHIKKWWEGEVYYLEGILPGNRYKRHWTAKFVRGLLKFYLDNWKWCIGSLFASIGLYIGYLKI